ncbi:hypothetical protein Milano_086 [Agrobacterium phage Milano]|nr:hypothetical protein Milano_086 [Agrobacterium phage Milano]
MADKTFRITCVRSHGKSHSLDLSGFGAEQLAYEQFKRLKESKRYVYIGMFENDELLMFDVLTKGDVRTDG